METQVVEKCIPVLIHTAGGFLCNNCPLHTHTNVRKDELLFACKFPDCGRRFRNNARLNCRQ
ncbi:hypothetical protein CLF_106588 [Clonorchis sinensis]|uniref:Uncharacterized protein n=1 Tax=Clonorchis sinensis TaxID=79923 RepID=G7YFE0_CLOSI|nr:hypothetical protein CLF_106588 [Clonorchis sinensis]